MIYKYTYIHHYRGQDRTLYLLPSSSHKVYSSSDEHRFTWGSSDIISLHSRPLKLPDGQSIGSKLLPTTAAVPSGRALGNTELFREAFIAALVEANLYSSIYGIDGWNG